VWRVPNELQPGLLDPRSLAAVPSLATQKVAIHVGAQVPPAQGGSISGAVTLHNYSGAVGDLVIAAYAANAPPPPLGLGRPLAVQFIPGVSVTGPSASLPYALANLPAGSYVVSALLDPLHEFSGLLSFMSTPPRGAQAAFVGGAVPSLIAVGSAAVSGQNLAFDHAATPSLPFERPAFSVDPSSSLDVSSGTPGDVTVVKLDAGTPAGLPYAVAPADSGGGGLFHPTPAICGLSGKQVEDPTQSCTPGSPYQDMRAASNCTATPTHPWVSTQVYATPLDAPGPVAAVVVNACQFCVALTNTADCSATPVATPSPVASLTAVVTNIAINPATGAPTGAPLPTGHYAITAIEPTGQSWTLPNELAAAGMAQGAVINVTP
jgi:hypothetical protein